MVRVFSAGLLLVTWAATARAEEPRASSPAALMSAAGSPAVSADTAKASCGAGAPGADTATEEQAFSAELESFARRRMFTERLMAQREAEAFERAALRQARAAELNRQLTERQAAKAESEFDEAVALYLKKRELTRLLSAASRANSAPAGSTRAPSTPPTP